MKQILSAKNIATDEITLTVNCTDGFTEIPILEIFMVWVGDNYLEYDNITHRRNQEAAKHKTPKIKYSYLKFTVYIGECFGNINGSF
jgi:hypothetical protein